MSGRPRKWASNAERQRAYRDRRREELAEPTQLRDQVRDLHRRLDLARRSLARTRTTKDRLKARLSESEAEVAELVRLRSALQNSNQELADHANQLQAEFDRLDSGSRLNLGHQLSIAISQIRELAEENARLRAGVAPPAMPATAVTPMRVPANRAERRKTDRKKQRKKRGRR